MARLSLVPQKREFYDLYNRAAANAVAIAQSLIELLEGFPDGADARVREIKDLEHFLEDPDNAFILDEALRHIAAGSPLVLAVLRYNLLPGLWRRPVDLGDD